MKYRCDRIKQIQIQLEGDKNVRIHKENRRTFNSKR